MSNPTTPFSWQMPTATDLVTDLPADFEVFGQAVATSMGDLLGGTTGQVLSKTSATDMAFTWVDTDDTNAIQNAIVTAKGDLIGASASATPLVLAVGTDDQILVADSAEATGLKWATPAVSASGMTLINRTTYTAAASISVDSVFSATYSSYLVVFENVFSASGSTQQMYLKLRYAGPTTETGGYYGNVLTTQHYNTTITNTPSSGTAYLIAADKIGASAEEGRGSFLFQGVGNSSQLACIAGNYRSTAANNQNAFNGGVGTARTYTGFQVVTSSAANLEGTIAVYGLAEA
jgi:hypothetical protein